MQSFNVTVLLGRKGGGQIGLFDDGCLEFPRKLVVVKSVLGITITVSNYEYYSYFTLRESP